MNVSDESDGPEVAADYDDETDPGRTLCAAVRVPLYPGQAAASCIKEYGHWPRTDHRWESEHA